MTHSKDWLEWHLPYQNPDSPLSRRLEIVQQQIRQLLPHEAKQPLSIISICAGQGDDILGVLENYPTPAQIYARLVEIDDRNVKAARKRVESMGLQNVHIKLGDAALVSAYAESVPADIVLACGVFGNIINEDIFHTIDTLPQLCKQGAAVIWTRSRRAPDITPQIRKYFNDHDFSELDFIAPEDVEFSVGVHRYAGSSEPLQVKDKMFTFIV